ncbi:nucleotide exchange factor GrpE [uncultured Boseongicola sp.]|jgi:molecular chaperone GrpE|uniref:nucleotide exchange factor GrpE n=1 Tax=uncultured Boseongicola sp. TaxID=1648499 RepID=UPI002636EA0F|nr:nucleotide exchange factor GrpE [uncultured Boseongicola sp.]
MEKRKEKINQPTDEPTSDEPTSDEPEVTTRDPDAELEVLTDKWKRALAEAENARKHANAARIDGREHGVALAVEALAPAYDDICLAIEAARTSPDADNPLIVALLEGLNRTKSAFTTGLKALGIREIAPKNSPFDPALHEALQTQDTDDTKPGMVLVLHRPGFALGQRLIRPAHVTVSASPSKQTKD